MLSMADRNITKKTGTQGLVRTHGQRKFTDKLVRPDLLVLDNFGMRKLTATEAQDLCEILDARIGERAIVITSQLPLAHWSEVIADPVISDAIRDRLEHASLKFDIVGESYRAVLARRRAQGLAQPPGGEAQS